jgi:flagellar biosynthesis protein FlhF
MGAVTVLMLVPATADRRNVAEIMESFEVLNFNYLVITKVDETRHYELLTAAAAHSACPVAFITNGQRVPQDIRPAALDELVEMLVPEEPI